jgi:hypothetical protein
MHPASCKCRAPRGVSAWSGPRSAARASRASLLDGPPAEAPASSHRPPLPSCTNQIQELPTEAYALPADDEDGEGEEGEGAIPAHGPLSRLQTGAREQSRGVQDEREPRAPACIGSLSRRDWVGCGPAGASRRQVCIPSTRTTK